MEIIVYAHTKSKKPRILQKGPGVFDIYVTEIASDGKANTAITKALANHLGVAKSRLSIKRGVASKIKVFKLA